MGEEELWLSTPVPARRGYWLKRWLSTFRFGPADPQKEVENNSTCQWSRKRIVVALLVLAALGIMGLLLLLNYECIMVWHLCYEEGEYVAVPSFGDG